MGYMAISGQNNTSSSYGLSSSSSGAQVLPQLQANYRELLDLNKENYKNLLSAYQGGQATIANELPLIQNRYDNLNQNVYNLLGVGGGGWGVADPAAKAISRTYERNAGNVNQRLASAGLGNTTAVGNFMNQAQRVAQDSFANLGAQLADKAAGYRSQIGMAQQAAQMQGLGLLTQSNQGIMSALGGHRFANTAGDITGQFSNSLAMNSSQAQGGGVGGSGGVGGMGPAFSSRGASSDYGTSYGTTFGNALRGAAANASPAAMMAKPTGWGYENATAAQLARPEATYPATAPQAGMGDYSAWESLGGQSQAEGYPPPGSGDKGYGGYDYGSLLGDYGSIVQDAVPNWGG